MRKTIKKPLTGRALEITINKLKKIANSEEEIQAIIDKSIFKSWIGVFPLTEQDKIDLNLKLDEPKKEEKYQEIRMTEEEYYKSVKGVVANYGK